MERLRPYLDHGILELDDNAAERGMRAMKDCAARPFRTEDGSGQRTGGRKGPMSQPKTRVSAPSMAAVIWSMSSGVAINAGLRQSVLL